MKEILGTVEKKIGKKKMILSGNRISLDSIGSTKIDLGDNLNLVGRIARFVYYQNLVRYNITIYMLFNVE